MTPPDAPDPFEPPAPLDDAARARVQQIRRRVMRSANVASDMLEAALHALWNADHLVAQQVRYRDDVVDDEEVAIELECMNLLSLHGVGPGGWSPLEFRLLTFCLKVNADIERVADHATSIAKLAMKIDPASPPLWPTALLELSDRVPVLCQCLLRAVLDLDTSTARRLVDGDGVIDALDKQLFREVSAWIESKPAEAQHGLMAFRVGRELERVGDLLANIAEDVIYLVTGEIIRHQSRSGKRRPPAQA